MKSEKNKIHPGIRKYILFGIVLAGLFILLVYNFYAYCTYMTNTQQENFIQLARASVYGVNQLLQGEKTALDDYCLQLQEELDGENQDTEQLETDLQTYLNSMPERRNQALLVKADGSIILDVRNNSKSLYYEEDIWEDTGDFDNATVIGDAILAAEHAYLIPVVKPVFGNQDYYLILLLNMDEIGDYLNVVIEDQGDNGYVALKNQSGYLLYHTNPDQIGLHMVEGRKEKYPDLDMSYLDDLYRLQMTEEEQTYVYKAYWLSKEPIVKRKKISVFEPLTLDHEFWVLTLNLDYKAYMGPIRRYMYIGLGLSALIFLAVGVLLFRLIRQNEKQRKILLENAHLQAMNEAMEELNQERMQKLHAQKMGQIGVMTEKIAHDFKNYLVPVMGRAEFLLEGDNLTEEQIDDAQTIINYAEKAADLAKRLNQYGKKEKIVTTYADFSIGELLLQTKIPIADFCPKEIYINDFPVPENCTVYGNADQIEEVLLNLAKNAVDTMKERLQKEAEGLLQVRKDPAELSISCEIRTRSDIPDDQFLSGQEREYVLIFVGDNGCGIMEEEAEHLFDPFFTTKAKEGTGLGLSISRDIILQHGGNLTVTSEYGKGSTFRICLPCSQKEKNR